MIARPAPWAIAHRGASRDCPENTIAAFDEALRQGADGLELDVQLTRDAVPVVYHDRTLARAGGGRRRVARLTWEELERLDPGARVDPRFRGQHIPSLEETLERYAGRTRLLVELKTRETGRAAQERHRLLARSVVDLVERKARGKEVMLLSFDSEVLEACGERAPGIPRVLNLRPPPTLTPELAGRLGSLSALSVDVRTLTPGFAEAVQRAGRPLVTYTCNTRAAVARALRARARGVISDRPGWLLGILRSLDEA